MRQFGCAHASSGVTPARSSTGRRRNGPPDAVRISRRMPARAGSPTYPGGRHWNTALCSLSIGSSVAPPSRAARMKTSPPITSASLLAIRSRLPARAAASVGSSPAAPTMAASTVSAPAIVAASTSPAGPASTLVRSPSAAISRSSARAASRSSSAATAGRKRRQSSASFPALRCAASASTA